MIETLDSILDAAMREAESGPAWLAAQRRAARDGLTARGLPTVAEEAWKYTSLKPLAGIPMRLAGAADAAALQAPVLDGLDLAGGGGPRLVIVNGHLRADLSTLDALPTGISVRAMRDGELPASALAAGEDAPFTALNLAALTDGIVIDIAPGHDVAEPLSLVFVAAGDDALLRAPRVLLRAGRDARARIIEEYVACGDDHGLTNVVTDIDLAAGAVLEHHRVQNEAPTGAHVGRILATVGANADFHSDSIAFGGALARVDIDVRLAERGARCRLNGLFAVAGTQHVDHHTTIDHAVGDTHSEELYRGILDGRSRGVFNGKVIVRRDAQQISARQASNNLLLSRQAEIDTKPELEIYADDVTCAHGATVGELDAAALFYLRSRGVSESAARALLTYAFAERVIHAIPLQRLRRALELRFIGHGEMSALRDQLETP